MKHRVLLLAYIMVLWFAISFVTNLINPLMPIIIRDFHLSLGLGGFLPFSFFLAYGLISIPAGSLVEARGPRTALLAAFALNFLGCLAISAVPNYAVVVGGLFVIGLGMAMLQVVINPLMRTTGGEAHFAFFSVMAQFIFGLASFVSPLVFSAMMERPDSAGRPLVWVGLYAAFCAIYVVLFAITAFMPLPRVELDEAERVGSIAAYRSLLKRPHVWFFFFGIFAYVGTEQSLGNWMSEFLSTYHGISPTAEGADTVGRFWGLMSVACLLGMALLRVMDSQIVLRIFTSLAIGCLACALFGSASTALIAFPMCGFFLSVMFSIVLSLGMNSVADNHGALAGILCTGIVGGALVPWLVGALGDVVGLRMAMMLVFATLAFIFSVSLWAKPLVKNRTVPWREILGFSKSKT